MINLKGLVEEILQSLAHVEGFDKIYIEKLVDSNIEITADKVLDRKSTRLNSSHSDRSRMPSSA